MCIVSPQTNYCGGHVPPLSVPMIVPSLIQLSCLYLTDEVRGSMQMSMRKLNSHTILQNCCCHVMYKLLYPSIRVRTAAPVLVRVRLVLVLRCNAIAHIVLHVSRCIVSRRVTVSGEPKLTEL